jgi:phenylacetate-CoA ligase
MVSILKVLSYLNAANKRLTWDKTKLKNYQDKQLKFVVKYAYQNVPFYHKSYKEAGVDVNSFRGMNDLDKLPIIKKEEFKHQPVKEITSSEFELATLKKVRTSGSTGTPFEVYLTPKEDAWRKAIYMRANINCGQKPFDRWVVLTSPTHFGDTSNVQRKIGVYAQNCISLFESTDNKLKQIAEAKPNILDGYSGAVTMLAREVQKRDLKNIKPRLVFGNAEYIDPQSRKIVEEAFNAPYCDQFGCSEA